MSENYVNNHNIMVGDTVSLWGTDEYQLVMRIDPFINHPHNRVDLRIHVIYNNQPAYLDVDWNGTLKIRQMVERFFWQLREGEDEAVLVSMSKLGRMSQPTKKKNPRVVPRPKLELVS